METKLFELRDQATFIPILAVNMDSRSPRDFYLLGRCGYPCDGRPNVAITKLDANGGPLWNDPYAWGGRTFPVAHRFIIENWDSRRERSAESVGAIRMIVFSRSAPAASRVYPS